MRSLGWGWAVGPDHPAGVFCGGSPQYSVDLPSDAPVTIVAGPSDHGACVNAWMERTVSGLPAEQSIQSFEEGFAVLWRRAHQPLGDVTLMAIADRVLDDAKEHFPILSSIEIEPAGLRCQELRAIAGSLPDQQLAEGIRFVLVEFLTVLGNLTADTLTPALHAELSRMTSAARSDDQTASATTRAKQ